MEQKLGRKTRRTHSAAFKAKVALAKLVGENTRAEFVQGLEVHSNKITKWKRQLSKGAADVFGGTGNPAESPIDLKILHAKIGQRTLENDFFRKYAHTAHYEAV